MANYQLGPVIGKIGGGEVEVITEEVTVSQGESRTWELPDGWESGIIGAQGQVNTYSYSGRAATIFGHRLLRVNERTNSHSPWEIAGGFAQLPASISVSSNTSWSGTITLIRTA